MIREYSCIPLISDTNNLNSLKNFTIDRESEVSNIREKIIGLEAYLKRCAWEDDQNNDVKIYLITDKQTGDVAAYFGLKAGMVIDNQDGIPTEEEKEEYLKTYNSKLVSSVTPGIEISHFAINDNYRRLISTGSKLIRGLGQYFYPTFIYPIIENVASKIGVSMIYLYAAGDQHLVNYYEQVFGFHKSGWNDYYMPLQPGYDGGCTFMYQLL